ncbi:MAG: glucose-1-phosphate thymidylyltransferase RfbA [Verrucomicrobia bacterium]|nr:glucose-1-phosphate thymidylyltransferase RfbA [Verrucomicrobiota bacterium]
MKQRKGIILAGGAGTRLYPLTEVACKQLLPIYDKPMIYYPLSTLMLGGIRDILIISTPKDTPDFEALLGDGSALGIRLSYQVQPAPQGIAQAFLLAEDFLGGAGAVLILGDNIFYGKLDFFRRALAMEEGACVFGYHVRDPERFGVVEFGTDGTVISIEEKPVRPKSHYAVPGLYVYDGEVVALTKRLLPSARGELEITDLNVSYLREGRLKVELLGRGIAWLDTGTPASMLEASNYMATIENQQNLKVACLEEIAYNMGFIDRSGLERIIHGIKSPDYRAYLRMVLDEPVVSSFPG